MGELPLPSHFDRSRVGEVRRVAYESLALEAEAWADRYQIPPAATDRAQVCVLLVDVQNTFCIPGFELFVGGRSGSGAVEDNGRLCEFLYRNLASLTQIVATLDTHATFQIFHAAFLLDAEGHHPRPQTSVTAEDVAEGRWRVNPRVAAALGIEPSDADAHLRHYASELGRKGRFALTIWPYHAMLGGIGHALVAAVEEAIFFHSIARTSQAVLELKGSNPLTEHYSAFGPEVTSGAAGQTVAGYNEALIERLLTFDAVVVAGQAKSDCVAWTIEDLLAHVERSDPRLAQNVYLLEDCTSPVVVPGVVDYTDRAEAAFRRFAAAGIHLVRSTEPIASWPGFPALPASSPAR